MKRYTCDHGEYDGKGKRCRKRATTVVVYQYVWAHRMDMKLGNVAEYAHRTVLRCPAHETVDIPGNVVGTQALKELAERERVQDQYDAAQTDPRRG